MKVKVIKPFLYGEKGIEKGTIEVDDWKAVVLANKGYVKLGKVEDVPEEHIDEVEEEKPRKKSKRK